MGGADYHAERRPLRGARLQTFAQPGQVVVGETTYAQIATIARVRPLGTPALKDKSDPIAVYELLGLDLETGPAPYTPEREHGS